MGIHQEEEEEVETVVGDKRMSRMVVAETVEEEVVMAMELVVAEVTREAMALAWPRRFQQLAASRSQQR